ncbi:unnamed protein product [Oikopleura dioica]|uniref:Uncharacterized protein n=1 Tax=Oikopleura dioica TaxID=34765 RepID=E4WYF8_OIKDI|nr:unnamed protein product [Oikopleura dioica]
MKISGRLILPESFSRVKSSQIINCLFICFEIKEENRLNFIRLFYSFSLSKALMFIFAVFKSIQVKSQRGCQSCGGFGETMTISVPWQDIVENFTNGISSIYFLCLLIFFFAFFNLS